MSKTLKRALSPQPAASTPLLPYEAPRLEVVELRPEEQLLGCIKSGTVGILCLKFPIVS